MPTLRFETISGNWKPFKGDWKNVFCFTVKALFALKIFKSLTWLFYSCRKMAHKKAKFNFKIYDVINREMSNYNHVLSDISRCKGNQKMKYGQLIGYSMRYIFLKESYTKCGGETSSRSFSKTEINSLKFYTVCFYCMSKSRTTKMYWNWGVDHLLLLHIKHFQKIKRALELVCLPHFLHGFQRKVFLTLYSINWQNFIVWLLLILEILCNMWFVIFCFPVYDVIILKSNLAYQAK